MITLTKKCLWTMLLTCTLNTKEYKNSTPLQKFVQGSEVRGIKGLLVDLNADVGVSINTSGQVYQWENQAPSTRVRYFKKNDIGRKYPCQGCPTLRKEAGQLNGHQRLAFRKQELVNNDEDAFDRLITGNGYTFFCVLSPYTQKGELKDVNSFFGNLRNGGNYEGIWAGLTDDNRVWAGTRNGITFGRWDENNPFIASPVSLQAGRFYLIIGKMEAGTERVEITLYVNSVTKPVNSNLVQINVNANSSKLAIGQERDAIEHPGVESFEGEIARFLLYERPLTQLELQTVSNKLISDYDIPID